MHRYWLPMGIFIALCILLWIGLGLPSANITSPWIGKSVPTFTAHQLLYPNRIFTDRDLRGRVMLMHVWATWCVSCLEEHNTLLTIANNYHIPIVGLNYKDDQAQAEQWLKSHGDPYAVSIADDDGRIAIEWGVYGTPETYVIDKRGIIREKLIGPITEERWITTLLPLVKTLDTEV